MVLPLRWTGKRNQGECEKFICFGEPIDFGLAASFKRTASFAPPGERSARARCFLLLELVVPMKNKVIPVRVKTAGAVKEDVTGTLIGVFKRLISEGSLVPARRLPAERELAEMFGVARSSLRQALKVLEIMGVISQRVGDGTYLNTAAPAILAAPMEFLILVT